MSPEMHLVRADEALREIMAHLAKATPSPRTREHRARAGTFQRAIMNLAGRSLTAEQAGALLEAVLDLHGRVFQGERPAQRSSFGSVPVAGSNPALRAITAPRIHLPPQSQRPTAPPPAPSLSPAPPSKPRPSTPGMRSLSPSLPVTTPPPPAGGDKS